MGSEEARISDANGTLKRLSGRFLLSTCCNRRADSSQHHSSAKAKLGAGVACAHEHVA